MAEINLVKKSIPKDWAAILKSENSIQSIVYIKRNQFILEGLLIKLEALSNKLLYKSLINKKY